jgi:hypothetical protein
MAMYDTADEPFTADCGSKLFKRCVVQKRAKPANVHTSQDIRTAEGCEKWRAKTFASSINVQEDIGD